MLNLQSIIQLTESLKKKFFILFILGISCSVFGQNKETEQDSTEVYKKIEDYSRKTKVGKMMHGWVFRPLKSKPRYEGKDLRNTADYLPHLDKTIRKINIKTHDPFGFSFTDSTQTARSWLERFGNRMHIKSQEYAIRDYLFFKEGDPLDTLLISESARLLRSQRFIREVEVMPKNVSDDEDAVDLTVTTLDAWSLIPDAALSSSQSKFKLTEYNFIGTGHKLELLYRHRKKNDKEGNEKKDSDDGYGITYSIPNFKNTYISGTARYLNEYDNHYRRSLDIDRIFYSPFTRWAGGVYIEDRAVGRELPDAAMDFYEQDLKFFAQDYWGGRSFPLFRGLSERERTTNLVITARALLVDYRQKAPTEFDPDHFFASEKFFLASVGVNSRQYIEDRFIFQDGVTEDVPVGIVYSVTGGFQNKNKQNRPYLGARASYGNYFNWGFLSINLEADTFFNNSKTEQTTYSFQANYFSHLMDLGHDWKMRQFIKPQFVIGVNRLESPADRLSLNEDPQFTGVYGKEYDDYNSGSIRGFDSPVYGTRKYIVETQTQFYSPWTWLGFRFNPYANLTVAMITDKHEDFGKTPVYASIGLGCLIRNDFLVFNTFQISFAYFPNIPGQGRHLFKPNSFRTDDFGFQEFQIAKPRPVSFQ